jgi:hypothetical protein
MRMSLPPSIQALCFPLDHWQTWNRLHGVTSQKRLILIVTPWAPQASRVGFPYTINFTHCVSYLFRIPSYTLVVVSCYVPVDTSIWCVIRINIFFIQFLLSFSLGNKLMFIFSGFYISLLFMSWDYQVLLLNMICIYRVRQANVLFNMNIFI